MFLITGTVDTFTQPTDVEKMKALLPEGKQWIILDDYNHGDVIWSEFAYKDFHP